MTSPLKPLPWQQELWQQMTQLSLLGQLSHAWLFVGPQGVGKRHFATAFTAFLLCENKGQHICGQCRSCQQLGAGHHPNTIKLQREVDDKTGKTKRDISVEQVRDMNEWLALSSHYGQGKIVVIDPADAFNQSSVNALLKTIEEPSANAYLLLISERPQALAATLRSRCQRLRFPIPPIAQSLDWLDAGDNAEDALRQSHGAPLRARELLDSGELERDRQWAADLTAIANQKRDPLALAASIGSAKAQSRTSNKEDAAEYLQWILSWLTSELRLSLSSKRSRSPQEVIEPMIRETLQSQRHLAGNSTPQLVLESLLVYWWRLNRQSKAV